MLLLRDFVHWRLKEFSQDRAGRPAGPGLIPGGLNDDGQVIGQAVERVGPDRFPHGSEAPFPGANPLAADDDQLRVEDVHQDGDADAQPASRFGQQSSGQFVARFGRRHDGIQGYRFHVRQHTRFSPGDGGPGLTDHCRVGGQRLQTAVFSTSAGRPILNQGDMSQFACAADGAPIKLTVDHNPGANPSPDRDHHKMVQAVAVAEPLLRDGQGVDIVLQVYGNPQSFGEG